MEKLRERGGESGAVVWTMSDVSSVSSVSTEQYSLWVMAIISKDSILKTSETGS